MRLKTLALALTLVCALFFANTAHAQILTPQGRLTLTSNTPVMTSDVVAATTIYYTPYVGNNLIVSNGTSLSNQAFSQLSLDVYDSTVADQIEDVYAIYVSGAFQLCLVDSFNPDRATRGSGFELTQLQGIWVNASTQTNNCATPSTNYTVPAQEGIYLGTLYTSEKFGTNIRGLTMQFTSSPAVGGTDNMLGVYNAYNRVPIVSSAQDSTSSWTYSTSGWRTANGSALNSISWVDGLQQSSAHATYAVACSGAGVAAIGVNLDSTTAGPSGVRGVYNFGGGEGTTVSFDLFSPLLGLHYVQAMEWASGTATFNANGNTEALTLQLEM